MKKLSQKDMISLDKFSSEEVDEILFEAKRLKKQFKKKGSNKKILADKTIAMIFEKSSLRTRVTFEVGMTHLGGKSIYLSQTNFKLGERESVEDVARNLERWVDGIVLRTFSHENVTKMAAAVSIPVINALSDDFHPCQALADLMTIEEHIGWLQGVKLVYIGDGNNVAASLAFAAVHTGMDFVSISPEGYLLPDEIVQKANKFAEVTGATITVTSDLGAANNADCLYTDVWASMGQEEEKAIRKRDFKNYQVNSDLLNSAKDSAIVLHCLPAHRGEEIEATVIDGTQSVVFDQAENRLHAQKAVLAMLMG